MPKVREQGRIANAGEFGYDYVVVIRKWPESWHFSVHTWNNPVPEMSCQFATYRKDEEESKSYVLRAAEDFIELSIGADPEDYSVLYTVAE